MVTLEFLYIIGSMVVERAHPIAKVAFILLDLMLDIIGFVVRVVVVVVGEVSQRALDFVAIAPLDNYVLISFKFEEHFRKIGWLNVDTKHVSA